MRVLRCFEIQIFITISCFIGGCLIEAGESFKHLAEIKYNLEDNVKQNFLDPLNQLQNKDLKEVNVRTVVLSALRKIENHVFPKW